VNGNLASSQIAGGAKGRRYGMDDPLPCGDHF